MFKQSHENGYLLAQKFGVRCAARLNNAPVAIFVLEKILHNAIFYP
jgi:hypothetical protein